MKKLLKLFAISLEFDNILSSILTSDGKLCSDTEGVLYRTSFISAHTFTELSLNFIVFFMCFVNHGLSNEYDLVVKTVFVFLFISLHRSK